MNELPQVYQKYELLFTPHLVPKLRDLRGEEWGKLIDYLSTLPETHPDALAFSMMMIRLNSCLTCEMDSYRAQRGCALCARQAILSFKGTDRQLLQRYERARRDMARHAEGLDAEPEPLECELERAA
jgi:RNase adaptor protein for sRNA GlmZ degradation